MRETYSRVRGQRQAVRLSAAFCARVISWLFSLAWDYSNFAQKLQPRLQNTQDSAHMLPLNRGLPWSLSDIVSHPIPSGHILPPYLDNAYARENILFICLFSLLQNQNISSRKTGIWACSLLYSQHIEQDCVHRMCSLYICWMNDHCKGFQGCAQLWMYNDEQNQKCFLSSWSIEFSGGERNINGYFHIHK